MKTNAAPQKEATIIVVTGRDESNSPGFVALDLGTGDTFKHFGRALDSRESAAVCANFAAWKKSLGTTVKTVELHRGVASVYFVEELGLPASEGASQVDLTSMFIGISSIMGEHFDVNARMNTYVREHGLLEHARLQGVVYLEVLKLYSTVARIYEGACRIRMVYLGDLNEVGPGS